MNAKDAKSQLITVFCELLEEAVTIFESPNAMFPDPESDWDEAWSMLMAKLHMQAVDNGWKVRRGPYRRPGMSPRDMTAFAVVVTPGGRAIDVAYDLEDWNTPEWKEVS